MKINRKRFLQVFSFALSFAWLAACSPSGTAKSEIVPAQSEVIVEESETAATQNRVRFSSVGDNLIHNGIYLQAQQRAGGMGYDFSYVYDNMAYFLKDFDVNWMNQETLVNTQLPPATYPCFSTPGELGEAAYAAGWNTFNLSTNHTYDMGAVGIEATMDFWQSMPEDTVVAGLYKSCAGNESEIVLQEVNGITIAYVDYTEHTNGLPTPENAPARVIYTSEQDVMEKQVRKARELADAVVVSLHWGVEGSHDVTPEQRELATTIIGWGADVIIGTHPHVIQPVEWIENPEDGRKAIVAYSLGNFLSAQAAPDNMIGLMFTFDLTQETESDGTKHPVIVENVNVYPTITHYDSAYDNIRCYMYKDYTKELAASHGVRARSVGFSMEYIKQVLEENVSDEFLRLKA